LHSAFLQHADGNWTITDKLHTVLDHQGDAIVNEDADELKLNLAAIGQKEGKVATTINGSVVFTDDQLFDSYEQCVEYLRATGRACLRHIYNLTSVQLPTGEVSVMEILDYYSEDDKKRLRELYRDVVFTNNKSYYTASVDPETHKAALEALAKKAKAAKEKQAKEPFRSWDAECLADSCSYALTDKPVKSFTIGQLWTWLVAHDVAFGKRATNKLALPTAKKWCLNREKNKKWLAKYVNTETAKRMDERLAAVCRK